METRMAEIEGDEVPKHGRKRLIEFLILSAQKLGVSPIVKYTALSLFADRFLVSLRRPRKRKTRFLKDGDFASWLLHPVRESNLQLFALVSIWISSKLHDTCLLSVKSLKSLGDLLISDQHFATQDFLKAELTFLEVLRFEIGVSCLTFIFLEELLIQFREISRSGELLNFNVCMDIMDLLYETEETSLLHQAPSLFASSIFAAAYVLTVPNQRWEFPLLPWVKVVTSYKEEEVGELTEIILKYTLKPNNCKVSLL